MYWQTTRFAIDLSRPRVMGIVNVTPDSFSDGGDHASAGAAIAHCERLVKEGADILDIGAESTRPGSPPLPLHDELERLLPVVRTALTLGVPVSVDTYKPRVMQQVLDLGADIINDIWALRQPGAAELVARHRNCGICLMHMHREPQTMQSAPMQGSPIPQVLSFLELAARSMIALGVEKARIVIDPGIGFGKTVEQNFALLARQRDLLALGYPVLAGWSHKSSLGAVTGLPVRERVAVSAVAAVLAVQGGAGIVRVHDVAETVAALAVWRAVQAGRGQPTQETDQ
ncbi:MAG: dihydropteroate synthase [Comamonas sp. SCN 65-56]|uniref:dihydropteroate synthase n=1 Tax=Comamonas sp. SCN 65-56 TaxID=1660095 RepID=UPI00086F9B87|nr:dihydropteroate synthase [Comamonas sp. SCN 65-56]ODS92408.1 MAG: dihydropteroate synthase [Comamonas sp. SCN 65-56]